MKKQEPTIEIRYRTIKMTPGLFANHLLLFLERFWIMNIGTNSIPVIMGGIKIMKTHATNIIPKPEKSIMPSLITPIC
jgi:hypothetical protein